MTKQPFLFLDIDGVLNSLGSLDPWGDAERHVLYPYGIGPLPVTLSRRMADAINDLGCEIWWTTTWQEEAYLVGDIIGIKGHVLDLDSQPGWKHGAVNNKIYDEPRPFIWFEDHPGVYGTNGLAGREHWPPHFVWNPSPMTGLTPEVIERAHEFLRGL